MNEYSFPIQRSGAEIEKAQAQDTNLFESRCLLSKRKMKQFVNAFSAMENGEMAICTVYSEKNGKNQNTDSTPKSEVKVGTPFSLSTCIYSSEELL